MKKNAIFNLFKNSLLILLLFFFTSNVVQGQTNKTYSWQNLSFETGVEFSEPQKAGVDAVSLFYPASASLDDTLFTITLVEIPRQMQEESKMTDAELVGYVKSVYLATALPAKESKERQILGKAVKGEVQEKTIPKKSRLEVYLLTLANKKVVISFSSDAKMEQETVEKIISTLAKSLKDKS
jgi:hypothetical protein